MYAHPKDEDGDEAERKEKGSPVADRGSLVLVAALASGLISFLSTL